MVTITIFSLGLWFSVCSFLVARHASYYLWELHWGGQRCLCVCRECDKVHAGPLSMSNGHVLRMQQPGSQSSSPPLPPHLRARWRRADSAEDSRKDQASVADAQDSSFAPWASGVLTAIPANSVTHAPLEDSRSKDADPVKVLPAQNGMPTRQEEYTQERNRDRGSVASGAVLPGSQLTFKGIVFDLETTGRIGLFLSPNLDLNPKFTSGLC